MGSSTPKDKAAAKRSVARWAEAATSGTAILGARLMLGETLTAADAKRLGIIGGNIGHAVTTLELAGFTVERKPLAGSANAKSYRVSKAPADAPEVKPPPATPTAPARRASVKHEAAGATHPQLGAKLTVRALALDERGKLVVQLSNGSGSAWLAQITGHVEQ